MKQPLPTQDQIDQLVLRSKILEMQGEGTSSRRAYETASNWQNLLNASRNYDAFSSVAAVQAPQETGI